ncbi:helix-hairpin-helix domain-containing protein [Arthrobacter zhaoxinii]|uniref:Helix-hairpin-helix domain-containing protein n=1 Tax=Arthrobacter zhaoxinii TaxID=2964616 RepID=A0ABY5YMD4_9MICC|nr:helix-hairpin-helix domain-containing protein [Arthrobacter zhaoxinii]UWX95843.1 helix-hairpin-helix domain-containing protein [Arthrobacter zhaoxinii]
MAQHRWDTADIHDMDGPGPADEDPPGLRRRWAFSLPAAVLAVCLLLGCGVAVVLLRDRSPVPVASIELSPPASSAPAPADGGDSPAATEAPGLPSPAPVPSPSRSAGPGGEGQAALVVHIAGAVQRPGIVRLLPGSRIIDAVDAAGGTAADADLTAVNLAALAEDGAMVIVPRIGEAPPAGGADGAGPGSTSAAKGSGVQGPGPPADGGATDSINLNTADSTELQTLPRVGPVLAERIIAWRTEHGSFSRPEDLDAVPGIGEAMMAALLPLVTV